MIEDFHRIKRLPPYVFAEVNRLKALARARGADIIDLGMGNPDMPTPAHIVDKMVETIAKPRTHRYSQSKGIPGLRKAQAAYYARRFGVKLNPDTQIVATLGSKEGFATMAQAISAPGDVVLVPNPTYPIHEFGFLLAGASMRHISANDGAEFLAGVERAVRHSIPKPIAMVLSYPSNPTGMVADLDFYTAAVQLAKKHNLILLSDIDGLYTAPPNTSTNAARLDVVTAITPEIEATAGDAGTELSKGGMRTKIEAAKIAMGGGTSMVITTGETMHPLAAIGAGARCTWFLASSDPVAARKRWIAGQLEPAGHVTIDAGAEKALLSGKSLLPAGVRRLEGTFDRGDAVVIRSADGRELGRGQGALTQPTGIAVRS